MPLIDEVGRWVAARLAGDGLRRMPQAASILQKVNSRYVDQVTKTNWDISRHLFVAAAVAVRRILIERSRQKPRRFATQAARTRTGNSRMSWQTARWEAATDSICGADATQRQIGNLHPDGILGHPLHGERRSGLRRLPIADQPAQVLAERFVIPAHTLPQVWRQFAFCCQQASCLRHCGLTRTDFTRRLITCGELLQPNQDFVPSQRTGSEGWIVTSGFDAAPVR